MSPDDLARVSIVVVATTASFAGIGMTVHYYWHRIANRGRKDAPLPDDRMARLEVSVEAIAIEVERIAEGQRFLTRLQTSAPDPVPRRMPKSEHREITPVS